MRQRVAAAGGELVDEAGFVDTHTPVWVRCRHGNRRLVKPSNVKKDRNGLCGECAPNSAATARAKFEKLLVEQGARYAPGQVYSGAKNGVEVVCCHGNRRSVVPAKVVYRARVCDGCTRRDFEQARADFDAHLIRAGVVRLPLDAPSSVYTGFHDPVDVRCPVGHPCRVYPSNLHAGHPVCGRCSREKGCDRVYLLVHPCGAIKVGRAGSAARVASHTRRGYELVGQWQGLSDVSTRLVESEVLEFWARASWAGPGSDWDPMSVGVPADGHTETTHSRHLAATWQYLIDWLGPPHETAAGVSTR